jgi:hypothetical protein
MTNNEPEPESEAEAEPDTEADANAAAESDHVQVHDHIHMHDNIAPDIRRAMVLPEHNHNMKQIDQAIHDDRLTPLVVNRKLYRAHRQMRMVVMEASKRFEDEQLRRTREELQAKMKQESGSRHFGAGLVMKRGKKKEVPSGEIRNLLGLRQHQRKKIIDQAARKGGRGRRARKKTVSDMSGMLPSEHSSPEN